MCFRLMAAYGVSRLGAGTVRVELGGEVAIVDLRNAIKRIADLIGDSIQLHLWYRNLGNLELVQKEPPWAGSILGQWKEARFVIRENGCHVHVGAVVGGGNLCRGEGIRESCVVLTAGFEAEFLGGENHGRCVVRTRRGKTGKYIPLREGNDLYVMTVGHLLKQGDMCDVVCKCGGGGTFTAKGECVLSSIPQENDSFSPDAALVKLINPEATAITHAFQHIFVCHGTTLHLTLPSPTLSATKYQREKTDLHVFLDGNTEPIKGRVSGFQSRRCGPSLIQESFFMKTDAPLSHGDSGSVVSLDTMILGLVVARNRHGSRESLVYNIRYALDYLCRDSKQYGDKAANFQVFSHIHE